MKKLRPSHNWHPQWPKPWNHLEPRRGICLRYCSAVCFRCPELSFAIRHFAVNLVRTHSRLWFCCVGNSRTNKKNGKRFSQVFRISLSASVAGRVGCNVRGTDGEMSLLALFRLLDDDLFCLHDAGCGVTKRDGETKVFRWFVFSFLSSLRVSFFDHYLLRWRLQTSWGNFVLETLRSASTNNTLRKIDRVHGL